MKVILSVVFSAVVALALIWTSTASAENIGTVSQPLSVKRATIWTSTGVVTSIPVCWESLGTDASARQWTQDGASVWEHAASVRFTGWNQCGAGQKGIRIQVFSGNPRTTALGNELDGVANGMQLNFDFTTWDPSCAATRQYCITAIAAHEFGHALGIGHEQNRSDKFDCTAEPQGESGDWNVTPYDANSIMNYCNPNWNGDGKLSELDKIGISVLYGKGPDPIQGSGPAIAYYDFPDSKQLETLFVSGKGALGLTWKANNGRWLGPVYLSKPDFLPRGAKIAVVNYPLNRQLEAFYAANDGAIYVSFKANNAPWSEPIRLTSPNATRPGAQLAAAFYPLNNQLEVLFVGNDGKINVLWKAQNGAWNPPVGLTGPNVAPPGGGISLAYYPLNNQLEGLFVGNNGAVNVIWKAQNRAWNQPAGLTGPGVAPPGAATSLTYYPLNQQLEGFLVDNFGAMTLIWKANNGAWSQPFRLSGKWLGVAGKPITSVYQPLNNQLEVFTVSRAGVLQLVWKANNGGWSQPVALSALRTGEAGAALAGQFQPLNNQLEVFYTDAAGNLAFDWKAQNGGWAGARSF